MVDGLIGIKVGMAQVFEENGTVTPVTVIKAGPCVVVQKKVKETDGYDADRRTFVQAFGEPELDTAVLRLPAVGFLPYDDERMVGTVDAIIDELEVGGLLRRHNADDGIDGEEAAFVTSSFWLVECLANQGRTEDARAVFDRTLATANDLGLFSEEHDTEAKESLGNFPQGLTHLSHISAAVALADHQRGGP